MKKIFLAALFISALAFKPAHAQLHISLNLNLGSQPDWGPTGYDHADYYYMPDIDCYYDINARQYVYPNGGRWVRAAALPPKYAGYDIYHGYKAVINQPTPYLHPDVYRAKYGRYKNVRTQTIIRDSRDVKYTRDRDRRPKGNPHDNGNHNGNDRGNGKGNDHGNNGHDNGNHGRGHGDH